MEKATSPPPAAAAGPTLFMEPVQQQQEVLQAEEVLRAEEQTQQVPELPATREADLCQMEGLKEQQLSVQEAGPLVPRQAGETNMTDPRQANRPQQEHQPLVLCKHLGSAAQIPQPRQQQDLDPLPSSPNKDSGARPVVAEGRLCPGDQQQQPPVQTESTAVTYSAHLAAAAQPQQPHHQSTHEPWGGVSCCELWSVCAYAVQGVVQQVCGGTPPSPGGLDACLAAVQLHGFLVRLAAGWWANPGAALEWLAAGFPQLSSAIPAVGRVLGQGKGGPGSGKENGICPGKAVASGAHGSRTSAVYLTEAQLQCCLRRLSGALKQAGADEQAIQQLCSLAHDRVAAEQACASSSAAAPGLTASTRPFCRETAAGCCSDVGCMWKQGGTPPARPSVLQPCLPCSAGRSTRQLMIAVAGAEGLALLGVSAQCLAGWVCTAMGVRHVLSE
jgi:hypothetical protein